MKTCLKTWLYLYNILIGGIILDKIFYILFHFFFFFNLSLYYITNKQSYKFGVLGIYFKYHSTLFKARNHVSIHGDQIELKLCALLLKLKV